VLKLEQILEQVVGEVFRGAMAKMAASLDAEEWERFFTI